MSAAELARLRKWKEEALPVIAGLQEVGQALGIPLGSSITGRDAVDAALDLRNARDRAIRERDALATLVPALQRLCDDEWLRDRDRLGGAHGARYMPPKAALRLERAAAEIRVLIEDLPQYDPIGSGGGYLQWMRSGRDQVNEPGGSDRG